MHRGEFFIQFFGVLEPNTQGEAAVRCPFLHDKGYETRPSAHINVNKNLFHCKTCRAEGRFNDGGLSEISFVAEYYGMTYEDAVQMFAEIDSIDGHSLEQWNRGQEALFGVPELMEFLKVKRGLTEETIRTYNLAYFGEGIAYPVIMYDTLCDIRTYHPSGKPAKMTGTKGSSPLFFPFDHWLKDERPTLLVGGENDALIGRQYGFNALTVTGGEGAFPKMFAGHFKNKTVYICYDCDEAGKIGARTVAFYLHEAGAEIYLVDLGLPGTKEDKDLSDFFVKDGHTSDDLIHLMRQALKYTPEDFQRDKNLNFPLVNLWDVPKGEYSGRRISSRVVLAGKYDEAMRTPTAIEWACTNPVLDKEGKSPCHHCPLRNKTGWWTLQHNPEQLMELVDVTAAQQAKALSKFIGMPEKCPTGEQHVRARQHVYKVIFTPDVETEEESTGFMATEQYAYTVGLDFEDGQKYRAFFRSYAHPLDGQRVYLIVDKLESSDNALNSFKMTPEIYEDLKVFQGNPFEKMQERADRMHGIPNMLFKPHPMLAHAVNIMYHSPLKFRFHGNTMKGYPEALMVGESRTGKTETGKLFLKYVGLGNYMEVKGASRAGLVGGADKLPNGVYKVTWGTIPRNHRGLVILDEMSDLAKDVFNQLTAVRSEMEATVHKIARGKAPAQTRLLWASNPGKDGSGTTDVRSYPNGVALVKSLVPADEDIARFDFIVLIVKDKEHESSPLDTPELEAFPASTYRNLIFWAWSRTADQIIFEEGVEKYIVQIANELNEKYDTDVKFFGAEAWKKLARIAVACATSCFNADSSGNCILVNKSHVDWSADFLRRCYDNSVFRLAEYVADRRRYNETNEAVNTKVAGICRTHPMVVKSLLNAMAPIPMGNLQAISALEKKDYSELINRMYQMHLITVSGQGVQATRRFRAAVDAYRANYHKERMVPLGEEGANV